MPKVEGLQRVVEALRARAAKSKAGDQASVVVGYTAAYAVYVHENLTAHHPQGRAKFLEEPARLMRDELGQIVATALRDGRTVGQALLLAGLRLQRESMLLCPVDTGNLRASAFTRLE